MIIDDILAIKTRQFVRWYNLALKYLQGFKAIITDYYTIIGIPATAQSYRGTGNIVAVTFANYSTATPSTFFSKSATSPLPKRRPIPNPIRVDKVHIKPPKLDWILSDKCEVYWSKLNGKDTGVWIKVHRYIDFKSHDLIKYSRIKLKPVIYEVNYNSTSIIELPSLEQAQAIAEEYYYKWLLVNKEENLLEN